MPKKPKKAGAKFGTGDRVAWGSRGRRKTGTVVAVGETRDEALAQLPKELKTAYKSERASKGPFYYVAADTPLFKPGFTAHSVPEHKMQAESESLEFKVDAARALPAQTLAIIATTAAACLHKKAGRPEILKELNKLCPEAFPLK